MSQQNVYEIGGSTDAITFYSSTQYGPPVGVDLNTGQQQIGNQIASQNLNGPLDIIGLIEQFSANTVDRIFDYIDQWSAQAGQAYQSFRERQDANTAEELGKLNKGIQTGVGVAQEIANVGSAVVGTGKGVAKLIDLSFSSPNPDPKQVKRAMDEIYGGGNVQRGIQNQNNILDTIGIRRNTAQSGYSNPLNSLEGSFNRQYERVTTGYESDIINKWQNPTLEPGWKSSDPYDPNKKRSAFRAVGGPTVSDTLFTR